MKKTFSVFCALIAIVYMLQFPICTRAEITTNCHLAVTSVTLRPSVAGVYFTASFDIPDNTTPCRKGIVVSTTQQLPLADGSDTQSLWSEGTNSALISNILRDDVNDTVNTMRGTAPIYVRAYAELLDGSYLYSEPVSITFQEVTAAAYSQWDALTDCQRDTITGMYNRFPAIMDGWSLSVSDDILSAMVKIDAREDFAFRSNLTNNGTGESSPITKDYYLSKYKVTNAQYKEFVDATGHKAPSYWKNGTYPAGKADHPVLNISYSSAAAYCSWLSSQYEDWQFRLPTEAEWENAAMGSYYGNTSVKYPTNQSPSYNASNHTITTDFNFNGVIAAKLFRDYGSDHVVTYIKGDYTGHSETLGECIQISKTGGVTNWANHGGTATKGYFLQTDLYATVNADGGYTTPVGAYPANTLGLYDMAGNSWDITSSTIVAVNGLEAGVSCYAVRGGSWYATARSCTFYYRGEGRKDSPSATVGFRLAADYIGKDPTVPDGRKAGLEKQQYSEGETLLNYWLYTPENAVSNMPLIVYLHGGSGKGDNLELITSVDGFPQYLQDGRLTPEAYVIIPQVSSSYKGWGDVKADVIQLISAVAAEYNIDPNRISLTGHSMGGTGAWMLALAYPNTFSALAPLSGSVTLSDTNLHKLEDMPIWAVVGTADTIVNPESSMNFIAELEKSNPNAKITALAGVDHFTVPGATYLSSEFDLISWLISQVKEPV